jgi:ketosteroid isomerase-like protein
MKKMNIVFLTILMSSFLFLFPADKKGNKNQESEKEIWALEEAYISYFIDANHRAILSMYHDRFLGWPDQEKQPADKKAARRYLEERYPKPVHMTYKIDRQGITFLNNIAINHYLLYITWKDKSGNEQKRISRLTHTWIKTGKQWKILGGMSNKQ